MSIIKYIEELIEKKSGNNVFVVSDFIEHADYETVKKSLARLEKKGIIRRIIRGVYDKPAFSQIINEYAAPSLPAVAEALARNYNWTICPCGDTVLNEFGLSTQVPAKQTYISSGPYRKYEIGERTLEFKHASSKEIAGRAKTSARVVQALKTIKDKNIDAKTIDTIGKCLSKEEKRLLINDAKTAPIWMYPYLKKISEVKDNV